MASSAPLAVARRCAALALVALVALAVASCGGSGEDTGGKEGAFTAPEVASAFEEAADGYPFEKAISLVDGAVAYGPESSADVEVVGPLNEALGESSVLWQVYVFDGPEPPADEEAAKAAAFASNTFDEVEDGVFLGDSDIAYVANENAVISGPVLNGDTNDQTLKRWRAVLEEL